MAAPISLVKPSVTSMRGHPMTAPGGKYALDAEDRKIMCYLDNGTLFILASQKFNPRATSFEGRLKRANERVNVEYVDLNTIQVCYEAHAPSVRQTDMQIDAKDLFKSAVARRASDIHIRVSQRYGTQILFRVHDDLEVFEEHDFEYGSRLCTGIYQAMSDVSDASFEINNRQDARIADKSKLPDKVEGIRIATSPQVGGLIMVLRLLYDDATSELGLSKTTVEALKFMTTRPTGMILISGPTGSGKSTTLQRWLSKIIRDCFGRKHVITVEDPPEYPITGAVQTPVTNASTEDERSAAFQLAIKTAMRLDPNIIMIGEMRDPPSAKLAVQAAMTGHQVWGTVHANSALAILDRLIDLGVSSDFVYDPTIISGLLSQRLLKLLCGDCKIKLVEHKENFEEIEFRRIAASVPNISNVFVKGCGCSKCNNSGTIGRIAVSEAIVTDEKFMSYLRQKNKIDAIRYWRENQGGVTFLQDAINKVDAGLVDPFMAEDVVGLLVNNTIEQDFSINRTEIHDAIG